MRGSRDSSSRNGKRRQSKLARIEPASVAIVQDIAALISPGPLAIATECEALASHLIRLASGQRQALTAMHPAAQVAMAHEATVVRDLMRGLTGMSNTGAPPVGAYERAIQVMSEEHGTLPDATEDEAVHETEDGDSQSVMDDNLASPSNPSETG